MVIHAAIRGLVLAVTLAGAVAAYAHAHLARANPAAGANVASAPSEVTLAFTQKLEPKFSTVVVARRRRQAGRQG
jgi:methionine-rich copper-binding protein CopC